MPRPIPSKEIYIVQNGSDMLTIYAHSEDAEQWVMEEAHHFGTLIGFKDGWGILNVFPTFDIREVKKWLESMGDEQTGDTPSEQGSE